MLVAFFSNFKKNLIEFKRYYFNSISGIITIFVLFYLIFFGVKAVGSNSPTFGDTIDGIIVGYFMWLMFIFSFQGVSFGIMDEAQRGTLEQVFMSPIPFEFQIFSRVVADFVFNICMIIPLMYLAAFTTKRNLGFNLPTLLYLLIIGVMGALGIGLILGGIALVFKRISSFIQIVTFGSLAFTMIDAKSIPLKFLPMSQTAYLMRQMAINKMNMFDFPFVEHLVLWISSFLYLLAGILAFKAFKISTMKSGSLSQY
ncbi:ABC transporter permease [Kosmotoga pacifica]|uniref:ABC transporter n=1 Tax=Kosmotoga pacifica TaxID=1330330 RepID=A0A0G2Z6V0_9BACT|nr:ABC transporter [Kosmotoga pacifica]AKI97287.1 ABC transporter [Kosmotoga pacifica]